MCKIDNISPVKMHLTAIHLMILSKSLTCGTPIFCIFRKKHKYFLRNILANPSRTVRDNRTKGSRSDVKSVDSLHCRKVTPRKGGENGCTESTKGGLFGATVYCSTARLQDLSFKKPCPSPCLSSQPSLRLPLEVRPNSPGAPSSYPYVLPSEQPARP